MPQNMRAAVVAMTLARPRARPLEAPVAGAVALECSNHTAGVGSDTQLPCAPDSATTGPSHGSPVGPSCHPFFCQLLKYEIRPLNVCFVFEHFGATTLGANAFITGPGRYRRWRRNRGIILSNLHVVTQPP